MVRARRMPEVGGRASTPSGEAVGKGSRGAQRSRFLSRSSISVAVMAAFPRDLTCGGMPHRNIRRRALRYGGQVAEVAAMGIPDHGYELRPPSYDLIDNRLSFFTRCLGASVCRIRQRNDTKNPPEFLYEEDILDCSARSGGGFQLVRPA